MATARPLCGGGCEPCCSRPAHNLLIQLVHLQVSSFRYVLFSKNALGLHCRLSGVGQSQKRRKKGKKKKKKGGCGGNKDGGQYFNSALGGANNYTWPRAGRWALCRVEAAGGAPTCCSQPRPFGIREMRTRHACTQLPRHARGCPHPSHQQRSLAAPQQREGDGDSLHAPPSPGTLPASLQPPGCSRRMRLMQPPRNHGPRGHAGQAALATRPDPAHGATLPPSLDSNPAALQPWPNSTTATSHGGRPLPEATVGTPPLPPRAGDTATPAGRPAAAGSLRRPAPFAICFLSVPAGEGTVRRQMRPREGPRGRSRGRRVGSRQGCAPRPAVLTHSGAPASPPPWGGPRGAACTWRASGGRRSGRAGRSRR